ncbi:hypothetical protein LguiA_012459 [Lonicera macranthoides]
MTSYASTSSTSTSTSTSTGKGECKSIAAVHRDIIQTHILTRLDGSTQASTACASPMLHALCTEQKLWKDMCNSTWSSINDPRVRHVISMFPGGYQSFYANSIPTTFHHRPNTMEPYQSCSSPTSELLSAVDIRFKNKIICSRVQVTKIVTNDFLAPPLWIDLLGGKETVPVPVKFQANNDNFPSDLEKSITLSWILIDPTRTCSVNLSSQRPVLVEWHNTPEEVQLFYVTILPGNSLVGSSDPVQCRIMVTCGAEEGGEMHVREVNMQVQDMDGVNLSREDSLVILQGAMGCERRKVGKGRERYEDFMQMKRDRRERNERREKRLDMVCLMIRVIIFVILLSGLFVI